MLPLSASRSSLVLLLLGSIVTLGACAAEADDASDDEEAAAESDLVEGSVDARSVLALVNARSTTREVLTAEGGLTAPTAAAIVARRDGADATPGTADDDLYDTLAELDAVRGVGPATLNRLLALAKKKGFGASTAEVIFSPQAYETSHLARIVKVIEGAQSTIDVAMYSYSDAKIGAALDAAVKRGVKVRFVFEGGGDDARLPTPDARASSKSGKLEASGIDVRFVNKIMHHKLMIVDGPRDDVAKAKTARIVTGSGNWSNSAATRYDENTLFLSGQEELTLRFQREFETMWGGSRDFSSRSPALVEAAGTAGITEPGIPDGASTHAWFTSANFTLRGTTFTTTGENTVANALVAAIGRATRSIHIASGHLRSRPVSEALVAKKKASPDLDVRVYLDGQEYISAATHDMQVKELEQCLVEAGASEPKRRDCTDRGFLFGYQVGQAGIDVRYKYYAYRWNHSYAPQMHHKYMVVDGSELFTGSYNLSDNAEHETFENMTWFAGPENAALVAAFDANFAAMWETGRAEGKLDALRRKVEDPAARTIPIVFDPMALAWSEVTELKRAIRASCPAVDSVDYRKNSASKQTCTK